MEIFADLLKIVLPAALVLYGMYLTARSFMAKDFERRMVELKMRHADITLPLRLQAYERMTIFLERLSMENLLPRVNESNYNVAVLQSLLLEEIRNEYNHNASQQMYMSEEVWVAIKNAMDSTIALVNESAQEINPEAPSIELAKKIIANNISREERPIQYALLVLKDEVKTFL